MKFSLLFVTLLLTEVSSFSLYVRKTSRSAAGTSLGASKKATLGEDTTWSVRFIMQGLPTTENATKTSATWNLHVKFHEDIGYEPPQGTLEIVGGSDADKVSFQSTRWQLSEDPSERKDGLWIWGLFQEPLYPFLLLQMTTEAVGVDEDKEEGETTTKTMTKILPLTLYAQINHRRRKEEGVVLDSTTFLQLRSMESISADVWNAAQVEIPTDTTIGRINILPL